VWWHRPFIPALRRQRQAALCEFKASLVYIVLGNLVLLLIFVVVVVVCLFVCFKEKKSDCWILRAGSLKSINQRQEAEISGIVILNQKSRKVVVFRQNSICWGKAPSSS
jgi:small-conductance mechanosensitive channel